MKVTRNCNMKCIYCYEQYYNHCCDSGLQGANMLDIEAVIRKFMDLGKQNEFVFVLHGGEPLLIGKERFRQLMSFIKCVNNDGYKYKIGIQTNATLLDDEWIELFKRNAYYWNERGPGVSIDGPKHVNDKCRLLKNGESVFDSFDKNIKRLKESGIKFEMYIVIGAHNVNYAQDIFDYVLHVNPTLLKMIPCFNVNKVGGLEDYSITPMQYTNFLSKIFSLWIDIPQALNIIIEPLASIIARLLGRDSPFCEYNNRKCGSFFTVYPDGDIYNCDSIIGTDGKYLLGNVYKADYNELSQILNGEAKPCSKLNSCINGLLSKCSSCEVFNICCGGCIGVRGEVFKNNPALSAEYCKSKIVLVELMKKLLKESGSI